MEFIKSHIKYLITSVGMLAVVLGIVFAESYAVQAAPTASIAFNTPPESYDYEWRICTDDGSSTIIYVSGVDMTNLFYGREVYFSVGEDKYRFKTNTSFNAIVLFKNNTVLVAGSDFMLTASEINE